MESLPALFSDLYTKFLLRDFVGKIVPGSILLFSLVAMFVGPRDALAKVTKAPVVVLIVLAGFVWTVTLGVQSLSDRLKIWAYFPSQVEGAVQTEQDFGKSTMRIVEFQWCATDGEMLQYERFVVIKEACGNLFVEVLLSVPCWLLLAAQPYMKSLKALRWHRILAWSILLAVSTSVIYGLGRMHRQHVQRQWMFADGVAALRSSPAPTCWERPSVSPSPSPSKP
jgi:hypothetical protein